MLFGYEKTDRGWTAYVEADRNGTDRIDLARNLKRALDAQNVLALWDNGFRFQALNAIFDGMFRR